MRKVKEWIGRTDDSRPPPSVVARIFMTHEGICHITNRKIAAGEPWDVEHVLAICNGGENRESNMAPALRSAHRGKTASDRKIKKKTDGMIRMNYGIRKAKHPMPGSRASGLRKRMNGAVERR